MSQEKSRPSKNLGQGGNRSLIELRRLAVRALAEILSGGKTLDDAILFVASKNTQATMATFDRSWLQEVVSGTLRHRGRIEFIIDTYALKKKPSGQLRRYLMTAVTQLLTSDSAPPALIVSETVQAIRDNEGEPQAKFANAILRKVADQRQQWIEWKVSASSPQAEIVAWSSLPEWLWKALVKQWGFEAAQAWALAALERPVTWARNAEGAVELEALGDAYIQDIANQELVKWSEAHLRKTFAQSGVSILDLCAAPGGKAIGLAQAGWNITATDIHEDRLQKVLENRNRLGLQSHIQIEPYAAVWKGNKKWDFIWLDVPCSSTGVVRRHPEIRWNRQAGQVAQWTQTQAQLVEWAQQHLNPGGKILYSTCSALDLENRSDWPGLKAEDQFRRSLTAEPRGDEIFGVLLEMS